LENNVLNQLGFKKKKRLLQPKIMSPNWAALNKWNQRATYLFSQVPDLSKGKYPVARGFDCIDEVKHGCSASPSRKPTSLFVLKLSAVTHGLFQPLERKFIENKKHFRETFSLRKNDILICRTNGTLSFVGRPVKIDKDWPELIFPDKLMRIRCNKRVLPDFLTYMFATSIVRPQIEAYARTAVGNYAIGNEDVFNLYFPLPPISVQEELINVISERQNEFKKLKKKAGSIRGTSQKEIEQMILGFRSVEGI